MRSNNRKVTRHTGSWALTARILKCILGKDRVRGRGLSQDITAMSVRAGGEHSCAPQRLAASKQGICSMELEI
jgi:hypothetical protein